MSTRQQSRGSSGGNVRHAEAEGGVNDSEIAAAVGDDAPTPLQTLLTRAHRASYDQHDVLYHQGAASETIFFVTEGLLKLVTHLPNGRARIVRLHRAGSVLGLTGLLGKRNEHTAVAVTPLTVLRLPIDAVQHLRAEDPTTYVTLVERWHEYLREADMWITQFSTGPIPGRVARLLSFLSDFQPESADGQLWLLTCDEIGSILGVTGESVSRVLADFKRQHILTANDSGANEIYDADVNRLRDIANTM